MKRELFARLEAAVRDVAEMPKRGAGSDFWMTFVEVPEGGWGLGGRAVSIGELAPVFTLVMIRVVHYGVIRAAESLGWNTIPPSVELGDVG